MIWFIAKENQSLITDKFGLNWYLLIFKRALSVTFRPDNCLIVEESIPMNKIVSGIIIMLISSSAFAQKEQEFNSTTRDAATGQPLPFVHIVLKNSGRGLMSNDHGSFVLPVSDTILADTLLFSCIGYELARVAVSDVVNEPDGIMLQPKSFELDEVVVFPLRPEEYILRAVEKIPVNNAAEPSLSNGYYSELMSENDRFLKYDEAVTDTWVPAIGGKDTAHTSILHARTAKDLVEMQFMRERIEQKQKKKARKRAKRSNDDASVEVGDDTSTEVVSTNFGGPSQILTSDPTRNLEAFMKSENFKKFDYQFEPHVAYGNRKLMVISYKQRRQIDQSKTKGKIYLDMDTDAIVAIEYTGRFSVPTILKPVLFAMGYGIDDPVYSAMVHYREHNGRWHVNSVHREIEINMTKKYLWHKNEKAKFDIEQTYTVHELKTEDAQPIKKSLRMTKDKTLVEQAQFSDESFWDSYSTVRPQKLAVYLNQ